MTELLSAEEFKTEYKKYLRGIYANSQEVRIKFETGNTLSPKSIIRYIGELSEQCDIVEMLQNTTADSGYSYVYINSVLYNRKYIGHMSNTDIYKRICNGRFAELEIHIDMTMAEILCNS